jgi:hypothetical protein
MGFKMNGSPVKLGTISGTAGHRSALKMVAEQKAASALKEKEDEKRVDEYGDPIPYTIGEKPYGSEGQDKAKETDGTVTIKGKKYRKEDIGKKGLYKSDKSWGEGQDKAKEMGGDLDSWTKERRALKKSNPDYKNTNEYKKLQNKINEALGNSYRYKLTEEKKEVVPEEKTKVETIKEKGTQERKDIIAKEEDKMSKEGPTEEVKYKGKDNIVVTEEKGGYKPAYAAETKSMKSQQKEDRKISKENIKSTERGSDERETAKKSHKELKAKQERERRQNKKDQKANKLTQKAKELKGKSRKYTSVKNKADKATKKAEEFATKEDYKKTWWNPFD